MNGVELRRTASAIHAYTQENGYPPTIRDLQDQLGILSSSTVSYRLDELRTRGFITREPERSRGIRLTPVGLALLDDRVPCVVPGCRARSRRLVDGVCPPEIRDEAHDAYVAAQEGAPR